MSSELPVEVGATGVPEKLIFDGRGGELFVVYVVNILLTILTLGIYRFWGKTRIRQYVWSHLRYQGDAFEYTGTGKELFLGFVIVFFLFFLPVAGITIWAQKLIGEGKIGLAIAMVVPIYLAIFVLFPMAIYRAYRYRLSRSLWRGIRFGLGGKPWIYARKFIGYTLLQIITLGLATPLATIKIYDYLINNIWMGSGRFSFDGSWKPLMKPFLMFWVCVLVYVLALGFSTPEPGATPSPFVMLAFPAGIAAACFFFYYSAAVYRHVVANIKFDDVSFSVELKGRNLFGLYFINGLLLVFTLGIAFPWVVVRVLKFMVRRLDIHGTPDFEKISQSTEEMPKYGEGLAEAFDIGSI